MIKKNSLIILVSCCISCTSPGKVLTQDEMEEISDSFHLAIKSAILKKDMQAVLSLYEDDGIYLPMRGAVLEGKENISKGYQRTFDSNVTSFRMERLALSGDVDYIIEVGLIQSKFQIDTVAVPGSFKYQNTYRRQSDGSYKMHRAIYNMNQN